MKNKVPKKIGILGYGWLGKPLATHLNANGYFINATTTTPLKLEDIKAIGNSFCMTIDDSSSFNSNFFEVEILVVNIPSKNREGFKNLITQIEKSSIKKIVFISSTSVYSNSTELITEEFETNKSDLAEIEQLFLNNNHFKTTIIRFAGLFGYDRNPGNFFKNGRIISNPNGFVNMIHRDDCIAIIAKIIENEIWNEIFNACSDSHPTRKEFYTKASLDIGLPVPLFDENVSIENKIISNDKLKKYLNYEFKYNYLITLNFNRLD